MCFPMERAVEKKWDFNGLQCVVARADLADGDEGLMKHRCGYVRIPQCHKWHGKDYDDIDVSVHGGLTFSKVEPCSHVDGTGYWIGFDCAHSGDASVPPGETPMIGGRPILSMTQGHYWTLEEVQVETEQLAK